MLLPLLLCCFLISFLGFSLNLNFIFQILEWLVHKVDLPLHYPFVLGKPSSLELIILFVLIGLFVDSFSHKKRRFFLIGFIFLFFFITKNPMRASITAVDIGQGDSIFLQDKFNKENILIDTGGQLALPQKNWQKAQTQSNADKTLIPYLESMGMAHIDQLILTHTDADHVGDFLSLADKIKIREIWVSPGELTNSSFVEKLKKQKFRFMLVKLGIKFRFLIVFFKFYQMVTLKKVIIMIP